MKLGVYIHGSSPFNPKTLDKYYELAELYDSIGIDTLWFADHLIRTPDPQEQQLHETWALITAIAMKTKNVRLGTMVTPITFRDLGYFAKMVTTVDHISNGRITVGLGNGWYKKEHDMFGIKFPDTKTRFVLLEESLDLLTKLWTQDKVTSPENYSIQLQSAYLNPKSIQQPHPPLLIGGAGEKKTLKFVAKYGSMSNFGGTKETITKKINVLKRHCNNLGRDFNEITITTNQAVVLGENEDEVEQGISDYRKRFEELGMNPPSLDGFRQNRLVGTPDDVLEQIQGLEKIGVGMINLTVNDARSEKLLPNVCKILKLK